MKKIAALIFFPLFLQGCSSLFYYPDRYLRSTPKTFSLEYTEYFIDSEKNELVVWHIPPKKNEGRPDATVVQFHGNAENMSSHFATLVWMAERNMELLTFDYRGYGASDGKPSQLGLRQDGLAALDEAYRLHRESGSEKLVVYAQSLGGAVALDAIMNWEHRDEIDLLALDSTFSQYSDLAALKLKSNWLSWPLHPLAYLVIADETSPRKRLSEITSIPTLVVHGNEDTVVPIESGKEIFKNINGKKFWWMLDGGKHLQNFHGKHLARRDEFIDLVKAL